jgi:hypothetical protein
MIILVETLNIDISNRNNLDFIQENKLSPVSFQEI